MTRFAGAAWLVSAVLAVVGSFVPYMALLVGGGQSMVLSPWQTTLPFRAEPESQFSWAALLAGAVMLAAAAVLTLRQTRLPAARLIGTGGAGLVLGMTIVLMTGVARYLVVPVADLRIEAGTWLLILASLLPFAGIALTRAPRTQDDIPTPPMGIPVVRVLEPEYEEQE